MRIFLLSFENRIELTPPPPLDHNGNDYYYFFIESPRISSSGKLGNNPGVDRVKKQPAPTPPRPFLGNDDNFISDWTHVKIIMRILLLPLYSVWSGQRIRRRIVLQLRTRRRRTYFLFDKLMKRTLTMHRWRIDTLLLQLLLYY